METEMLIVLFGIGFFLLTGLLGGLGFYNILKNRKRKAILFFGAGFSFIAIYIIGILTI
jgi:hypothetical protein